MNVKSCAVSDCNKIVEDYLYVETDSSKLIEIDTDQLKDRTQKIYYWTKTNINHKKNPKPVIIIDEFLPDNVHDLAIYPLYIKI